MMFLGRVFVLCFLFIFSCGSAYSSDVLGFKWGVSLDTVMKDVEGKSDVIDVDRNITALFVENPLKPIDGFKGASLVFDEVKGLCKVVTISKSFTGDIAGDAGKKRFSQLESILSKKYTKLKEYKYIGESLYDEYDEFYQCLDYPGCGQWATVFKGENRTTVISIVGESRGVGYIKIAIENDKLWSEALAERKKRSKESDSDAL